VKGYSKLLSFVHVMTYLQFFYSSLASGTSKTTPSSLTIPSYSDKSNSSSLLPTPRSEGEILSSPNLKAFSFNELKNATRNFRPDSLLGEGGFGHVYKGWIDEHTFTAAKPGSGMVVAVKRLKPEGFQGHKEWLVSSLFLGPLWDYLNSLNSLREVIPHIHAISTLEQTDQHWIDQDQIVLILSLLLNTIYPA
jgi:hypothetical protein